MGLLDKFIPKEHKETLDEMNALVKKVNADPVAKPEMDTVLAIVGPMFDGAGKETADPSLKTVFNDVAVVLPFFKKSIANGSIPMGEVLKLLPTLFRLGNGSLNKVFDDNGPEISKVNEKILANNEAQTALGKVLLTPVGQEMFALIQKDGTAYAVEQLSGKGIKFPVREDIYNNVTATLANKNQPPKGPAGPAI